MDRGAWWATVRGMAELDTTERLTLSSPEALLAPLTQIVWGPPGAAVSGGGAMWLAGWLAEPWWSRQPSGHQRHHSWPSRSSRVPLLQTAHGCPPGSRSVTADSLGSQGLVGFHSLPPHPPNIS